MSLPLIDYVGNKLFDKTSFQDFYIIGVQHILPSTYTMFQKLFEKGLDKNNLS